MRTFLRTMAALGAVFGHYNSAQYIMLYFYVNQDSGRAKRQKEISRKLLVVFILILRLAA